MTSPNTVDNTAPAAGSASVSYAVDNQEKTASGSILVQADKDKLPRKRFSRNRNGSGSNKESITVNFLFDLKPGIYPVVALLIPAMTPMAKDRCLADCSEVNQNLQTTK